ncbi:hypothetical protein BG015_005141, partial [Linnemannia schmuckeri]
MAVSTYVTVNAYTRSKAIACLDGLRLAAASNCEKKHYSATFQGCTCMYKFGANIVNDRNAATENWFQYIKDRVNDASFHGSTVFEYDINGPDMIGAI